MIASFGLAVVTESEEALLKMSVSQPESGAAVLPDFSSMTEEEQIAYAMQMSLAGGGQFHLVIAAGHVFVLSSLLLHILDGKLFWLFSQNMARWTLVLPWTLQNLPR